MRQEGDLWVFGYGSLVWQPGFEYVETEIAELEGYVRRFCMWSIHYRGTPENPGLVLALDQQAGGSCMGLAFRVAAAHAALALAGLRARELVSSAYVERSLTVTLADGRQVQAVCYVIDPSHAQYCGELGLAEQVRIIGSARGDRGPNRDYLFRTNERLESLGISDPELAALAGLVQRRTS